MKRYAVRISTMFIFAWMASFVATAQFDDIYFDPDADELYVDTYEDDGGDTYVTEDYYYDDDEYDYYDDEDYHYSSRIRRFNRPSRSFGYYDPFFYDPFYIDPFFVRPGISLAFGTGFNRFNRWNRWNRYSYGYDPFFYNPFYGGSRFNSLSCYFGSPVGYGGYGFNNYYGGAYGYGRNVYNVNNYYESFRPGNANNNRGTYYGARRSGAVSAAPGRTIRAPRVNNTRTVTRESGDAIRRSGVSRTNTTRSVDGVNRTRTVTESARTYRTPRTVTKTYNGTVRKPSTTSNRRYAPTSSSSRTIERSTQTRVNRPTTRSTYAPRTSSSSRKSYSPSKSSAPRRSYTPSRSSSSNKSYSPSRSSNSRSYTPSRSSTPSRSYSPSSSPSRSSSSSSRSSSSSSRRR